MRSGTTVQGINKDALPLCEIHLAHSDTQIKCIEADAKAENLISELSALKNRIWDEPRAIIKTAKRLAQINRDDSILSWLETLPFPLASVLWAALTAGDDFKEWYAYLLHFFEAVAEFYGIVLWSATASAPALRDDPGYPVSPAKPFKNSFDRSTSVRGPKWSGPIVARRFLLQHSLRDHRPYALSVESLVGAVAFAAAFAAACPRTVGDRTPRRPLRRRR